MPSEGIELTPNQWLLSKEEIIKIAKLFVQQGVTKIRLTGGEPLVRQDLPDIIGKHYFYCYILALHIYLS